MMRVLQIHNAYKYAGGEDSIVDLEFQLLRNAGLQVKKLCFDNENIRLNKVFFNRNSYKRTSKEIHCFRPDVVHLHNIFYQASPSVLKAVTEMGIPIVMTLHNFRLICPGALLLRKGRHCTKCVDLKFPLYGALHGCFQDSIPKSFVLSAVLGHCNLSGVWKTSVDRYIILTPYIKSIFSDSALGVPSDAFVVKPNSTSDFASIKKELPNKRKGYVYIGRISKEKGVGVMVQAFNAMPAKQLAIVGTGPMEEKIKRAARPNISFLGMQPRDAIGELLKRSRALIFPSLCLEGMPNVILEAFSASTPVIASKNKNLAQIITEGYNGLLFRTGSQKALKEAINQFEKRNESILGKNARTTYESKYTHDQNLRKLLRIYQEVIAEKQKDEKKNNLHRS